MQEHQSTVEKLKLELKESEYIQMRYFETETDKNMKQLQEHHILKLNF